MADNTEKFLWLGAVIVAGYFFYKANEPVEQSYSRGPSTRGGGRGSRSRKTDAINASFNLPISVTGMTALGLKLKNPLNIRYNPSNDWQGQINPGKNAFAEFATKAYGYRAAFRNLNTYVKRGQDTLLEIIPTWAPASDKNDVAAYLNFVTSKTGIPSFQIVNQAMFDKIIAAMALFETGDKDAVARTEGYRLAFG